MKMSCNRCSVNFSLFKRKKYCQECHRFFCSTCLPKPQPNSSVGRQCSKCRLLMSGHFSRDDLQTWKINDMRCFLNVRNISTQDCREKHDLIELVIARFCTHQLESLQDQIEHETLVQQMAAHVRDVNYTNESSSAGTSQENSPTPQRNTQADPLSHVQYEASTPAATQATVSSNKPFQTTDSIPSVPRSSSAGSSAAGSSTGNLNNSTTNHAQEDIHMEINSDALRELLESMERIQAIITQQDEVEQSATAEQSVRRTQLSDITDIAHIDDLSIRQLKELLVNNFVDYKGCCEKAELVEKTKRLWKDYQENKIRAQRIHNQDEAEYHGSQLSSKDSEETSSYGKLLRELTTLSASTPQVAETEEKKEQDTAPSNFTTPGVDISKSVPKSGEYTQNNDSLCNICMDSLVDCILLECGHMVTCTQCGKRLAACPICRQYIVRVVRVFRS